MRFFCVRLLLMVPLVAGSVSVYSQKNFDAMWDKANTAYINGEYGEAITVYDSIASAGYTSKKLCYNLGNAYFKEGMIGKSILYYNRALRLAPGDNDIKHNLNVANTYVKDKIDSVPEFFLTSWIRGWRGTLGSNTWAILSLVMLSLALGSVLLYLFSGNMRLRKTGFYGAMAALAVCIFAVCFSVGQKRELLYPSEAVVMISAAPVKSSPDNSSKDIFVLHEGTRVSLGATLNHWVEITIADGNKGWIHEKSIEVI